MTAVVRKYAVNDRVDVYVKKGQRICFDSDWHQNTDTYGIELRSFKIVGFVAALNDKTGPGYIVLVDDASLESWPIGETHLKDAAINTSYRGKPAYCVFDLAIRNRSNTNCDDCKEDSIKLKKQYISI